VNRIITIAALLFLGFSTSFAQPMKWKKLADRILSTARNDPWSPAEYGAISVKDSIILAGWKNGMLSTDAGNTWMEFISVQNLIIFDIEIYDVNTFAIASIAGVIVSSDKGETWEEISHSPTYSILFDGAKDKLICVESSDIVLYDKGIRQYTSRLKYNITDLAWGSDKALYIKVGERDISAIYRSDDHGYTWNIFSQSLPIEGDCFSFICNKTDPNRFAVINEDWIYRTNQFSEIFVSSDVGKSWTTTLQQPLGSYTYLTGSSTQGCNDYFVGTSIDGILRSSDKGMSWNSIGGPATPVDSRTIFAVDDSIIYAIDTLGSIWVTDATKSSGFTHESIADIYTDTIGGDITVPINFKSSVDINAEFTLHFDTTDLVYKGTFDSYNIDHTIWVGNETARIRYNPSQDSILYARFLFFPTDSNCTKIRIDSLIEPTDYTTCATGRSLTATICGPEGCGISTLSRFIRYGTTPTFTITPNPTRGTITLQSNMDIDDASIEIRNQVGAISYSSRSDIKKADVLSLDVSSLPSGAYILLVKGHGAGVPLVIMK
jgi:hypothetical protein